MQTKRKINPLKQYDSHLVGYYGMQNSGDDALMYATLWGAKHIMQSKSISVGLYGMPKPELLVNRQLPLQQHQAFPGHNRLNQYRAAMQCERVIFGGGSVLHSESDINIKRHMMALSSRENSAAVGISLGPFQSVAAEKACAQFLNECGFVGVRDQESLNIAQAIAPNANVKKTFDLAPLLLCNQMPSKRLNRSGVALALCPVAVTPHGDTNAKAERKRLLEICHLIERIYARTGEPIILLTFNGHQELGDGQINQQIINYFGDKLPIIAKPYDANPMAVLQDLASYKAIVSMRLHGSIMGFLANTPVFSVNYHPKCVGWCEQVGMAQNYRFAAQDLDIDTLITELDAGLNNQFIAPTLPVSKALELALSNWSNHYEQA